MLGFTCLPFSAHTDIQKSPFIASTTTVESSSRSRVPEPIVKFPLPTAPVYKQSHSLAVWHLSAPRCNLPLKFTLGMQACPACGVPAMNLVRFFLTILPVDGKNGPVGESQTRTRKESWCSSPLLLVDPTGAGISAMKRICSQIGVAAGYCCWQPALAPTFSLFHCNLLNRSCRKLQRLGIESLDNDVH